MEPQRRRIHLAQRNSLRFLREEEAKFQRLDKKLDDEINFFQHQKSQLNNESNREVVDTIISQFRQVGQKNENVRITNRDRYESFLRRARPLARM